MMANSGLQWLGMMSIGEELLVTKKWCSMLVENGQSSSESHPEQLEDHDTNCVIVLGMILF